MRTRVPRWIRHRQAAAVEDLVYAVRFAAAPTASKALVDEAMQLSHDALIEELGDRRRSGVQWVVIEARKAPGVIAELQMPGDFSDLLDRLTTYPEGRLIMAMAKAVRE